MVYNFMNNLQPGMIGHKYDSLAQGSLRGKILESVRWYNICKILALRIDVMSDLAANLFNDGPASRAIGSGRILR